MKQDVNKAYIPSKDIPSFNAMIQKSILDNWDRDALTDFKGKTLQYHDVEERSRKYTSYLRTAVLPKETK